MSESDKDFRMEILCSRFLIDDSEFCQRNILTQHLYSTMTSTTLVINNIT